MEEKNNQDNIDSEAAAVTEALLNRAKEKNHSEFVFIRSYQEYLSTKTYRDLTEQTWQNFSDLNEDLKKEYLNLVAEGKDSLELLLAYKNLLGVIKFYAKEVAIIKDILAEYHCYVRWGHIIDTILGNYRPEEDLIDYRKLPINWWN